MQERIDALPTRDELAGREDLTELHQRIDALPTRDELVGRDDLSELHQRIDLVAGRDELDELRRELERQADELAERPDARGELAAFVARLDTLADHDELVALAARVEGLAGPDELAALREQLDALAPRDEVTDLAARSEHELAALRQRLDGLGSPEDGGLAQKAFEVAQDALTRIAAVDRGAGTVLADVKSLREALALARDAQETGRAEVEELRELVARHGGELEVTRGQAGSAETEALGARQAAAAAGEAAHAAREDAARARDESVAARLEVEGQRERTTLLAEQLSGAREAAASAKSDAAQARTLGEGLTERLTVVDQRSAALKTELGAGRERIDALGAHLDRIGVTVLETGESAAAANERTATLKSELGEVRHVAETAARGLEILRAELAGFRDVAETLRTEVRAAGAQDQRIEAMQSELTFALSSLEELKQGLSSAGQAAVIARREAEQARKAAQHVGDGSTERVTEVFQQILGLAAARNQPSRRPGAGVSQQTKPEAPKREPRHGFDDEVSPMAILSLDGKFKQLNPAFTKLVGYKEHEFTKAAWPSPHDRRDYKDQLEQLRQIGLGELREIPVQSTYMHGQGLMVPVVGKLTLEMGEDGLPLQLVLEAEDRHTG